MLVSDIMSKNPITVTPDTDIHKLAELFVKYGISGAPVAEATGKFLGVVLEESLIFHDKKVHLPSFLHIAMGFITFGVQRFEEEVKKITASKVSEIMENETLTLSPQASIESAATLMIERGIYYCPVVREDELLGVVTKKDIVRSIAEEI